METYKKRALTKVRRDFLFKKAEENEEQDVDSSTRLLSNNQVHIIAGDIGLVEINREICLELYHANGQYKIGSIDIEKRIRSLVVNVVVKRERSNLCPWEYTVRRLESFGDLGLATWAHKIKTNQSNHAKLMKGYYDALKQNDPNILKNVHEAGERARLLCQELENSHAFYKVRYFADQDGKSLKSLSYDDGFLKKLGHTVEDFGGWVLKNGIPTMSEQNSKVNLKYGQLLLDYNVVDYEKIFQGPEQPSRLVDQYGFKKDITMRTVFILEPSEEGIYMNTYYILIDKSSDPLGQDDCTSLKLYKPAIQDQENQWALGDRNEMEEESRF